MKQIKIYIALLCAVLISCDKFDEVHHEYIDDVNEQVYSTIPEDVSALGGLGKVKIEGYFIYTSNLDKLMIEYQNEVISQDLTAPENSDTIFFSQIIDNFEEGTVDFRVYSVDIVGNSSIVKEKTAKVYGEVYQKKQLNRQLLSATKTDTSLNISFGAAPDGSVKLEFNYLDSLGEAQTATLMTDENLLILNDAADSVIYNYKTYFLPSNAFDSIPTFESIEGGAK
jgi:hypothetical protein